MKGTGMKNQKKSGSKKHQCANATTSRKIVFVDIENFVGKPQLSLEDTMKASTSLKKALGIASNDLVVIGTSHSNNFFNAKLAWNGAQHVWGKGHNGADVVLLETIDEYALENYR